MTDPLFLLPCYALPCYYLQAEEQQSRSLLPSLVEKIAAVKAELGALNSERADAEEASLPLHAGD